MRRAAVIATVAAALALCPPEPTRAQEPAPQRMNAIGLIDFGARPAFKVGDFAKYHMSALSAHGVVDDYTLTVLIAGEEDWWGEECFWIETWTQSSTSGDQTVASLMAYDVFQDSLALKHMQLYVRKTVDEINEDGSPKEVIYRRPTSTLKTREPLGGQFRLQIDTLGTETITVAKGTFECRKLRFLQGRGATGAKGDSTDYTELREERTTFLNLDIPITHIVREDINQSFTRKAWKVGHSKEGTPTVTLDQTSGSAELVDFGHGLAARMVPEAVRRSLAAQRAASAKPAPAPKPAPRRKTG